MPAIHLSQELKAVIEAEVHEQNLADSGEYLARLVQQDQQRRAHEQMQTFVKEGFDSGPDEEMTAQSWRDLRLELHRQAGIE